MIASIKSEYKRKVEDFSHHNNEHHRHITITSICCVCFACVSVSMYLYIYVTCVITINNTRRVDGRWLPNDTACIICMSARVAWRGRDAHAEASRRAQSQSTALVRRTSVPPPPKCGHANTSSPAGLAAVVAAGITIRPRSPPIPHPTHREHIGIHQSRCCASANDGVVNLGIVRLRLSECVFAYGIFASPQEAVCAIVQMFM